MNALQVPYANFMARECETALAAWERGESIGPGRPEVLAIRAAVDAFRQISALTILDDPSPSQQQPHP